MQRKEREYGDILVSKAREEERMERQIEKVRMEMSWLEREKFGEWQERVRLEDELKKNSKRHEDEITLRLKFEEKLNCLHALNRLTS